MFIPSTDAHDTSYFLSQCIWNPEDEHVNGGSDFDDPTDTCSSGSYIQDEDIKCFCIILSLILMHLELYGITQTRNMPLKN